MSPIPQESVLREAYWDRGETLVDLGRKYGRAPGSVHGWFKKYGIPTRSIMASRALLDSAVGTEEVAEMRVLYERGFSSNDIGEKLAPRGGIASWR